MFILKVFVRQLIKVIANSLKMGCFAVHYLAPKARFTLPNQSGAWWKTSSKYRIPKVLWQTNFTNRVTLAVYLNYLFNRLMSPSFDYRFMVTADRRAFVAECFDKRVLTAYDCLQIGAAQADLWRTLVLQKYGGVYLDIDAHFTWPVAWIVNPDQAELYIEIKTGEVSNYFIASAPDNPRMGMVIEEVVKSVLAGSNDDVYSLTGPGVFNRVFHSIKVPTTYYAYSVNQGNFANEFFQYIDKPEGKWTKEQRRISVLKPPK